MEPKPVTIEDFKALSHAEQKLTTIYEMMSIADLNTLLSEMSTDYEVRAEIARYLAKLPSNPPPHKLNGNLSKGGDHEYVFRCLKTSSLLFKLIAWIIIMLGILGVLYNLLMGMNPGYWMHWSFYESGGWYSTHLMPALCIGLITFWAALVAFTISAVLKLFINLGRDTHQIATHKIQA